MAESQRRRHKNADGIEIPNNFYLIHQCENELAVGLFKYESAWHVKKITDQRLRAKWLGKRAQVNKSSMISSSSDLNYIFVCSNMIRKNVGINWILNIYRF